MNGPIGELLKTPDFLRLWLVGAFANAMRWLELLDCLEPRTSRTA